MYNYSSTPINCTYHLIAGVSYFVFGEKIDVYSGTDPLMKEFIQAGLDYIESVGLITRALPIYRIYPTKAYRDYKKVVRRMQRAGEYRVSVPNQ